MSRADPYLGAAWIARKWQRESSGAAPWHLRWKPVCASTELELSKWIYEKPLLKSQSRAFLSARQTHGRGQRGRIWQAPRGGVWLSASIPWVAKQPFAGVFGLAVAVALAERLESSGLAVKIKWPNDLIVEKRKLAGLLPSLIHRGTKVRFARIGLGLNVCNRVPLEGIRLLELLGPGKSRLGFWTAEVLFALDRAISYADQSNWVCKEAKKRLWVTRLKDPVTQKLLEIEGLEPDGGLRLSNGSQEIIWRRWR